MMQQEFGCLVPQRDFSRREFVRASVARRSKFVVFPEAGHAFHADNLPSCRRAAAAEEGWRLALHGSRCTGWLDRSAKMHR